MEDYDARYPWIKESISQVYHELVNLYELRLAMEKRREENKKQAKEKPLRQIFAFPEHMRKISACRTTLEDEESGLSLEIRTYLN